MSDQKSPYSAPGYRGDQDDDAKQMLEPGSPVRTNGSDSNAGHRPSEGSGVVEGSGVGAGGGGNPEDPDGDPVGGGGALPMPSENPEPLPTLNKEDRPTGHPTEAQDADAPSH